ncbi:MAG: hypothetical protein KKB50_06725 [Planctomycetes bacterium]|nr:hypothetical protein [Planctomycetota bacterium]
MLLESDGAKERRDRALAIIRQHGGGVEQLINDPGSTRTRQVVELLVWNEVPSRAPLPAGDGGRDADTAFVRRVCSKLMVDLRYLGDLADLPAAQKERILLRAVSKWCYRTAGEKAQRNAQGTSRSPREAYLPRPDEVLDRHHPAPLSDEEAQARWAELLEQAAPSRLARLATRLALYVEDAADLEDLLNCEQRFDVGRLSRTLGCTRAQVRELLAVWRREICKVKAMVPRAFRDVYQRLNRLAAASFQGLADWDLRCELFDISRSLAFAFGPEDADARAVKPLEALEFNTTVDLLLDERSFSERPEQRTVLEQLMQSIVHVREALQAGDTNRAFAHSARLVLEAARVQHHAGPARLQILQAYTYFLRLAGWFEQVVQGERAIAERCNALVREKGPEILDRAAEFESGETLRRVRTYAGLNQLTCRFNHILTSAPQQRFVVRDYDGLVALVPHYERLLRDDPEADFVYSELLVLRAHIARAAYNLHRSARGAPAKQRWQAERDRQRAALLEFVEKHFFTSDFPAENARRLVDATAEAAEGYAAERALDILEETFAGWPAIVTELRATRLAALQYPLRP